MIMPEELEAPSLPVLCAHFSGQDSGRQRASRCGRKRRRSESNRRIEVLQTSALPLGYGAGGGVNSQAALGSASLTVDIRNRLPRWWRKWWRQKTQTDLIFSDVRTSPSLYAHGASRHSRHLP